MPLPTARITEIDEAGERLLIQPVAGEIGPGLAVYVFAGGVPIARGRSGDGPGPERTVTLECSAAAALASCDVVALPADLGDRLRTTLPAGGRVWCTLKTIDETGATGVLDIKPGDGFVVGDVLHVHRDKLVLARATLVSLEADGGRVSLSPLVANLKPQPDDRAALAVTPAERRSGRLRSGVLKVSERVGEQEVWFPLEPDAGVTTGDRFEVRDHESGYVGLLQLVEMRPPFAVGQTTASCCRRPVAVGDVVVRRDRRGLAAGQQSLRIFRVEGDYCLLNAGEIDGVERGRVLHLLRDGRVLATLEVETVKVDYCGARLRPLAGETPRLWDDAVCFIPPPLEATIGRVEALSSCGPLAVIRGPVGHTWRRGEIIRIRTAPWPTWAVVLSADGPQASVYLPSALRSTGELPASLIGIAVDRP